jgi:hypothetical protein
MQLLHIVPLLHLAAALNGTIRLAGSSGVPAMHAATFHDGRVVFLDKIENSTMSYLVDGRRAYSSVYDPLTSFFYGLPIQTNPFCSSGAFLADGRLISVGGNGPLLHEDVTIGDGFDAIRYIGPTIGTTWVEPGNKLASRR